MNYDIIIVGGGASGLFAAIAALKQNKRVLVIEKMKQCGLKLRITGKGRANITNVSELDEFLTHCGSDYRFLYPIFNTFFTQDTIDIFLELGLETKIERGGRVFPKSDKSIDVFFAIIRFLERNEKCTIIKNCEVKSVICENGCSTGINTNVGQFFAHSIILAAGGMSYPLTGSNGDGLRICKALGLQCTECFPVLVGLFTENIITTEAYRLRKKESGDTFLIKNMLVTVTNKNGKKLTQTIGEVQFTNYGIAGAAILKISRQIAQRIAAKEDLRVILDLKQDVNFAIMRITGTEGWDRAVITQGGVSLLEVKPKTLETKKIKRLYLCGELLDLDADTGGYNLQIAFSTGWVAGTNAALAANVHNAEI
ncbi:MAG: aminoacetone oxidase family FAD-binding enzyme [Bacteroidales bacterium]|jgi:predicted Rossmann fold flavoprotein|nr:aminoacetone oxidase family FAD-binding enzyme [Bacteroidales bacterium]